MRFREFNTKPIQNLSENTLQEFAPPGSGDNDDGFSEETLKMLAAQWWNGDEDPEVEQTLAAAGWEIGHDEGYDNGGVFVVQSGDEHGRSYLSWPAEELESLSESLITETIRKLSDGKYRLYSGKGRNLGTFSSREAAEKHEREVQFFKHR